MNKIFTSGLFALSLTSLSAQASDFSKDDIKIMKDIEITCSKMPHLSFPRSRDPKFDYDLIEYKRKRERAINNMEQLSSQNTEALSSDYIVYKQPFFKDVSDCKKLISETDAALSGKEEKKSVSPSKESKSEEVTLKKDDIALMKGILFNCSNIPHLSFPRPDGYDQDLQNYKQYKKYTLAKIQQLTSQNSEAFNSDYVVLTKPFSEEYAACKKLIADTDTKLSNVDAGKPDQKALNKLGYALESCRYGLQAIASPKFSAAYVAKVNHYESYVSNLEKAKQLDERVLSWKKDEIEKCNTEFLPVYQKMKAQNKNEADAKKEENKKILNDKAKSLGYDGVYVGVTKLIENLGRGELSLENIKTYLVKRGDIKFFRLGSVVDDYAIYGYYQEHLNGYIQVAVIKEEGRFYGKNSPMPDGYYAIKGMEEFTSVLGVATQLLVLERISD